MKSLLIKTIAAGLLTLAAIGSASANYQCRVHNLRGQSWYGTADSRSMASAYAMKFCVKNSTYASNCQIDYCHSGNFGGEHIPGGTWQCNATNARGQLWIGTGASRAVAAANASGFCTAHSAKARNCVINSCFIKY